jgi:hypothetical protein
MLERMVDDASRVVRIVFALNRVWPATLKRLAVRIAELPIKPDRLAERIDEALAEPDPRRAVLAMTLRAREWLREAVELLRDHPDGATDRG